MRLHPRRGLLIGAASVVAASAGGGAGLLVGSAGGRSNYQAAANETWRHAESTELAFAPARLELVRYATLAANSHNTQPWLFSFIGRAIVIESDPARRLSAVDPDDHHLFASLGCAVENIVQAAPAFGMRASPVFDPVTQQVRIELEPAPPRRGALFDAIPRRQSTRADFDGRPVADHDLRALEAAGRGDDVQMMLLTEPPQREAILAYLVAANLAQMRDPAFVRELKSWIRFGYTDALSTRDGLFTLCSGNMAVPALVGRPLFDEVFTEQAETRKYEGQMRTAAGTAVFVSDRNEPEGWFEAGRCCERFALQATALDLRVSYINQPVEVAAVRGQLATYLGVQHRPDIVMRFGHGPERPRSLRRPVEQVLRVERLDQT